MNNKLTIFVCGTYYDLTEERHEVLEAIRKLKHQHDSMEYFGARPERAIETCLDEVRQSDVLVVIVGHLYGSKVPDWDISFSEAEYNEGYKLGKPCLIYFRDENTPVLPKFMENDPDKMKLLTRFKGTLRSRHTTATFRDSHDLSVSVAADLSRIAQNLENTIVNLEPKNMLKHGAEEWNIWRAKNPSMKINLENIDLQGINLRGANLSEVTLTNANLSTSDLRDVNLRNANLRGANLHGSDLTHADLSGAIVSEAKLSNVSLGNTVFSRVDLSNAQGLDEVIHLSRSTVDTDTLNISKGHIPDRFLSGCGLSDWEIESAKLFNPELNNEQINSILYKLYDLRAQQAFQTSPLFISYSFADTLFVDKLASYLDRKGIRYWRDIHDMKAGRMEKLIDYAIRQNPTVLLIFSEHSLQSDWVEHEIRTAIQLEKDMKRYVLCPIAIDDSWKNSSWSKRLMEQIMEYNILDFSDWKDDNKFGKNFNGLIDGMELFYK